MAACVRSAERGRRILGGDAELFEVPAGVPGPDVLSECDAVINLAGSPLVGRRWSRRRLAEGEESRVGTTEMLVQALGEASPKPVVLVSASALGYYGDLPDEEATETAPPGRGYLAELCRRWEEAALRAESFGVRVVLARLGVVLGRFGGMLEVLEPIFRCRLGGRLSTGDQWFPWIHIDDVRRAVTGFIEDGGVGGPINLVAPEAVRYREFVDRLAETLRVGAPLTIPSPVIRMVLGEGASALLGGRRAVPRRLTESGFGFEYPDLESALSDLFEPVPPAISEGVTLSEAFGHLGVGDGRSGVLLQSGVSVRSSQEEVFEFYSVPANLAVLIPPRLPFRVVDPPSRAEEGTRVTYETGRTPFARRYRGEIFGIRPHEEFFDRSVDPSPFSWFHRHRFAASGRGSTDVFDDLWFQPPGGRAARRPAKSMARYLFEYRNYVTGWRFGRAGVDGP